MRYRNFVKPEWLCRLSCLLVNRADENEANEDHAATERNGDDRAGSQVPNPAFYALVHRRLPRWPPACNRNDHMRRLVPLGAYGGQMSGSVWVCRIQTRLKTGSIIWFDKPKQTRMI